MENEQKRAIADRGRWRALPRVTAVLFAVVASATCQAGYEGLVSQAQEGESIASRFPPPFGFERTGVPAGSYSEWLRGLPLLPKGSTATDWQLRRVFRPEEVGGVLNWRLLGAEEQCADIALRLLAEHEYASSGQAATHFRSLSGQEVHWSKWRSGQYGVNRNATAIIYRAGGAKSPDRGEYDEFLRFVMNYTNTASIRRDWSEVAESDLRIGDVVIQPFCVGGGMGHLSVIVDASENSAGERLYIFVDGYTPARDPVVRQRENNRPETVWMTLAEYLELQAVFGPGKLHRFPGW